MKIKFLKSHHIRSSPTDLDIPPIGIVEEGVVLEVEENTVQGAEISGISIWYKDQQGQYYWGGDIEEFPSDTEELKPLVEEPQEQVEAKNTVGEEAKQLDDYENINAPAIELEGRSEAFETRTNFLHTGTGSGPFNWGISLLEIDSFFWDQCQIRGEGVTIVLLDTGIETEAGPGQTHPALQHAYRGGRGFSSGGPNDLVDDIGHGTRTAGIIAAHNSAIQGIAPAVDLFVGKLVQGTGNSEIDQLIAGLDWALGMGPDIILANVAIPKDQVSAIQTDSLEDLVDRIEEQKVILIAPVGRNESTLPSGRYPACLPCSISVGAYREDGARDEDTQQSFSLDLLAPGVSLITTDLGDEITEDFSGPGAAAAFATGCLALLLNYFRKKGKSCCNPKEMIALVKQSATPTVTGKKIRSSIYGFGKIDPVGAAEECSRKQQIHPS